MRAVVGGTAAGSLHFTAVRKKKKMPIALLPPHVGPPPVSSGRFSHRYITSGVWFCAPVMRLLFHHESSYIFAVALAGSRALFTPPPFAPPIFPVLCSSFDARSVHSRGCRCLWL